MVQFRHAQREIQFKVVYYGPALGGKTSNLEALHDLSDPEGKTQVVSMKTSEDRTLFFDFLPFDLGEIQGYRIRLQVFTVPGQVHYNTTRKVVLSGADAIIFVADSQAEQAENNYISWENMKANLLANRMDLREIPVVVQCNKQDLGGALGPEAILDTMRVEGHPSVRASALTGEGVAETFMLCTQRTLALFVERYRLSQKGVTPEKIADGVERVFRPFLGKRRKGVAEAEGRAPAPLESHIPVRGLTEEEQLIAALESSTQLAERYQEAQVLSRKYEDRLREMTALYEVGTALSQVGTVEEAFGRLPEVLARYREGWAVSSFIRNGDTLRPAGCHGFQADPLASVQVPGGVSLAQGLFERGPRVHLKDLAGRFERVKAPPPAGFAEALGLTLGDSGAPLGHLVVYCGGDRGFGEEEDRFFTLLEQVAVPRLQTLALLRELARSDESLELRVIQRTADLAEALRGLEEVDRLKQTFLNSVSHEVKTPLTNIRSYADILLRYPDRRGERSEEYLGVILGETQRMEGLIDDLLAYSRLKAPARGEPADLASLLRDSLDGSRRPDVEILVQGAEEPLPYPINPEDAQILFRQLVGNAVKFSPDRSKVKVYLLDDPQKVIFAVRDFGPGIPGDQVVRLLKPFEKGRPQTPDYRSEGLGVGLFLVREVVEKYGGALRIESMEPGTNVLVELPKATVA